MSNAHYLADCFRQACIWEATARKAGNVHPGASFADLTYADFLTSAALAAPEVGRAAERPLGETILAAIRATRSVVASNTNLGIVLLLAPLAKANCERRQLARVLAETTVADSVAVFEAIRMAMPGGMNEVPDQDIRDQPTLPLREIMKMAVERDTIARQYVDDFRDLFEFGMPAFEEAFLRFARLEPAIQHLQLRWLADYPDSLIARKGGLEVAKEVGRRAKKVLELGSVGTEAGRQAYDGLDAWLRQGRNPGTTADLVTACLFIALHERKITPDTSFS
jgi:triphosphoribosyl-dephospho-CoA synthase